MPPTPRNPLTPAQQVGAEIDRAATLDDLLACLGKAATLADVGEGHRYADEILCLFLRRVSAGSGHARQARLLVHRFETMAKLYG